MFNKKNLFVPAVFVFMGFGGVDAANAQNPPCYTLASLQGTYAFIATFGSNQALALGRASFDGNGNLTLTSVINEPQVGSTTGERTIVTTTQTGTYTVNCDGTGVITRLVTSNGVTSSSMDDFLITGAVIKDRQILATAMANAQRNPSTIVPGGLFVTRSFTRLPDQATPPE